MSRPAIEVADIVRAKGRQFLQRFKAVFSYQALKAFRAVLRCRTRALGGHKDKCADCRYEAPISYNSCRSRCCPKCQAQARRRWVEAQQRDLLSTNYFHVVFTVPHELNPLALTSPRRFFDLLFEASSQALIEVAADPKRLGAEIGFLAILHTWGSNLLPITISIASFPPADWPLIISAGSTPATRCSCCPFRSCELCSAKSSSTGFASSTARACSIAEGPQPTSTILPGSSKWPPS